MVSVPRGISTAHITENGCYVLILIKKWSLLNEQQKRSTKENRELGTNSMIVTLLVFCNITLKNVVIDNLHLFLCAADRLIDLIVTDLKRLDVTEKCSEGQQRRTISLECSNIILIATARCLHYWVLI